MPVTCFLGSQISICPKSNRLSPSDQKPTDNSGCAHYIGIIQQLGLSANETLETFVEQQDMFVKSLYQMTRPVNVYNVLSEQTAPFLRYRLLDVGIQWRREQILDLNFETLEGIKDRDRDKITDALRQQLEALLKSQTELKENFPDYCT